MKIKIICVGKLKKQYLKDGVEDFLTRVKRYNQIEIEELKDYGDDNNREKSIEVESNNILTKLSKSSTIILLDIFGKEYNSVQFSDFILDQKNFYSKDLIFIIGGSYGVSEKLKKTVDMKLTFSKMTFSHQIVRIMFLEQLYRAFNIINNGKYHK